MTAISRRNFLLAGGAVLAIPPLEIAIRAAASSHGETIARILQDRLPGLTIPAERLIEFGDEFARRHLPDLGRRFRGALLIMDNDWAEDLLPESWQPEGLLQLLGTDYKFAVSFMILIAVLLFRPTGLFKGKAV